MLLGDPFRVGGNCADAIRHPVAV